MQKIQNRIPLKSLSSEPAVRLKTDSKPIKVLLITGDHKEAYLIRKMVTQAVMGAFTLEYADRLSVGIERLTRGGIDVLLLDQSVPDGHGLQALTQVRAQVGGIPIIILSPLDNEKDKIEALKKGAQECLVKGKLNRDLLARSIYHAIAQQWSVSKSESSEGQFNNIIKSYPDGIIIVDQKGTVCFANPAVESLFGCKAGQLLGESIDSLQAIEGGKTELGIVRGDGENLVAEVKVVEIKYQGETAYLASLRDITARKRVEEETKLARLDAETVKVTSAKIIAKASEEAKLAREDAEVAKIASTKAAAKAHEEARLAREEAEKIKSALSQANKEAKAALAKANEEARLAREEAEKVKAALAKAREEANKAKAALARASEEAKETRAVLARASEEARLAREDTETVKKTSAKAVAKAKQEVRLTQEDAEAGLAKTNEETRLAREEVGEVKAASARAVTKANEEARLAREEAEEIKAASAKAVAKAEEEARLIQEDAEATLAKAITKATKEAKLAREEAEATSARAIAKASEEVRLAREEAEAAKTVSNKAVARANKEAKLAREEAEAAKIASAKAAEETRLAREEADATGIASATAVARANKETRLALDEVEEIKAISGKEKAKAAEEVKLAREETEAARVASNKAVAKANEEARLALEEAEEFKAASAKAVARANEESRNAREEAEAAKAVLEEAMTKAAEKRYNLDPMQSEFMSNIVHELRAPLHSVLAFTKLLLEGDVSNTETQKEFLTIIAGQSEHLRKLVDELLDISPIESERFDINKERVAIADLLQGTIRDFNSVAKQKNIVIKENIPLQLPDIEADSQRLRQVMFNLLDNAIKFSNDGGSIDVSAEVRGNDLLVQLTDQGIGIAEEARKSLFEKFYQVKSTTRVGGLGLGLYISKRIIEAHGGRIWVESVEGAGSTFSFTIPLKQDNR
jgi:signal transduction histidine kinase/PAS domain-containing protein